MVKLLYTTEAQRDPREIHRFISTDSAYYAKKIIGSLRERIRVLKMHPEFGHPFYLRRYNHLRQLMYRSYRIIYINNGETATITVLAIQHHARSAENIRSLKDFEK